MSVITRSTAALVAVTLLLTVAAWGQTTLAPTVYVSEDPNEFPNFDLIDPPPVVLSTPAELADLKADLAAEDGEVDTVFFGMNGSPWNFGPDGLIIRKDGDVTLSGNEDAQPYQIVLEADGGPVIDMPEASQLLVEIVALTADVGLQATNGAQVAMDRCYVFNNSGNGVRVVGDGTRVQITNTSIAINTGDGVRVESDAEADIVLSTIIKNGGNGVRVESGARARVWSCVVWENTTGLSADATTAITYDYCFFKLGAANTGGSVAAVDDTTSNNILWDEASLNNPFLTTPWEGKVRDFASVLDVGDIPQDAFFEPAPEPDPDSTEPPEEDFPFTLEEFTSQDFEGELRAGGDDTGDPDIGADEEGGGLTAWWDYAVIDPPIVRLNQEFTVFIRLVSMPGTPEIFFVPQGGSVTDIGDRVLLEDLTFEGGYSWSATGVVTSTLLEDKDQDGLMSAGDLIADGHAVLYVEIGSFIIPPDDTLIKGEARRGRHFLIDTIPPRVQIQNTLGDTANQMVTLLNPIATANAGQNYAAQGLVTTPFPLFPTTWRPILSSGPYDDGRMERPAVGSEPKIFFNVASISNGYPVENLDIGIDLTFEDPVVTDASGDPIPGTDAWLNSDVRIVSGFDGSTGTATVGEFLANDGDYEVYWTLEEETALPTNLRVNYNHEAFKSAGMPDWPYAVDGTTSINDLLRPPVGGHNWIFGDRVNAPGIPPGIDPKHLELTFYARDRAGNMTTASQRVDPLHIWWMRETRTNLVPKMQGTSTANPSYEIAVDRPYDPNPAGGLAPIFTHRVWQSDAAGGPYLPVIPWSDWSYDPVVPASEFGSLRASGALTQPYVIIVAAAGDEAGNIQIVPAAAANGTSLSPNDLSGYGNWDQFEYLADEAAVDTAIGAEFWIDTQRLEPNNNAYYDSAFGVNLYELPLEVAEKNVPRTSVISMPAQADATRDRLAVTFTLSAQDVPPGATVTAFEVELVRDGYEKGRFAGQLATGGFAQTTLTLPDDEGNALIPWSYSTYPNADWFTMWNYPFHLGDGARMYLALADGADGSAPDGSVNVQELGAYITGNGDGPAGLWPAPGGLPRRFSGVHIGEVMAALDRDGDDVLTPRDVRPVHYTLRAWAVLDSGARDATPATYSFTVVPTARGEYVEPRDEEGPQPTVIFERQ